MTSFPTCATAKLRAGESTFESRTLTASSSASSQMRSVPVAPDKMYRPSLLNSTLAPPSKQIESAPGGVHGWRVARSHISTLKYPMTASLEPSGLKRTEREVPLCVAIVSIAAPVSALHRYTLVSPDPQASMFPSALKDTVLTALGTWISGPRATSS